MVMIQRFVVFELLHDFVCFVENGPGLLIKWVGRSNVSSRYPGILPQTPEFCKIKQKELGNQISSFFNKQKEIFSPLAAEGKFDYQST